MWGIPGEYTGSCRDVARWPSVRQVTPSTENLIHSAIHSGAGRMLAQSHPADGYVEFVANSDTVALRCHWPADLKADDWIDIQNHYSIVSYLQAVDDSMATGNGEAHGISGGYLRVTSSDDGGFTIEFSRPQDGWLA